MPVKRLSISLDEELATEFDKFISEKGFENRSEAIRELIQNALFSAKELNPTGKIIGTLSFVFDHSKHLNHKIVHEQHRFIKDIVGITQAHLNEVRTLETILINTTYERAEKLASRILNSRGVVCGKLTVFQDV
ncbi:nickel-responsive transcriptional regulator NikR [bacterium]|nr:nickel-responsive transcriptional regulator NikR [bacterium]